MWQRMVNTFKPSFDTSVNRCIRAAVSPPKRPNFDSDSANPAVHGLAGVSSCQGISVMGKAYFVSGDAGQPLNSASVHDDEDDGWDTEVSAETESLLEENARLRA